MGGFGAFLLVRVGEMIEIVLIAAVVILAMLAVIIDD